MFPQFITYIIFSIKCMILSINITFISSITSRYPPTPLYVFVFGKIVFLPYRSDKAIEKRALPLPPETNS